MILHDRTGAALRMTWHHFLGAGTALYTDGMEKSQNALVRGRQLCTQLSIFERSLAEFFRFLMLSSSKIEDVSQNCFVLDVVKCKKLKMSRRIVSLLDVVMFKPEGSLAECLSF